MNGEISALKFGTGPWTDAHDAILIYVEFMIGIFSTVGVKPLIR